MSLDGGDGLGGRGLAEGFPLLQSWHLGHHLPRGLIIWVLVGNRTLAGKVLPRPTEGTLPLSGLALHQPVPHLPTCLNIQFNLWTRHT